MVTPLTPDDPPSLGGHRLAGRLGEGGQGVVYLAHSPAGEPVAIKLLSTGDRETRARLARELQALESIASFCTARVLHASTEGPRPYVISEFIDGPSLADRVRDRGPLAGGELERVVVGSATALAAIHAAGIVHRDFKPGNVLLGPDGPRVVDFGIARAEGAATMTSGLIGTPAYLAPEQINGTPASPASDVFAWAASMVYAATGVSPFGADTVPAVLHRVLHTDPDLRPLPPRLRAVLAGCLAKDPSRRPTARDLIGMLVGPNTPPLTDTTTGGPHTTPPPAVSHPGGPAAGPSGGFAHPGGMPPPEVSGDPHRTGPPGPAYTTGVPRRRSRGVLIGSLAVLVALTAGGSALLWFTPTPPIVNDLSTTASPTPSADTASPSIPATEPTPAQEPTSRESAAEGGLKVPAALAGTWSGKASGTMLDKRFDDEAVTIILRQGRSTGVWESPGEDPGCAKGTLKLTQVAGTKLSFDLTGLGGVCAILDSTGGIKVSLDRKDEDRADYELTMFGGESKGELTKTG
ncbi:protein kinase [Nonomuraea sp. NPDC049714]|uniref:serine/threonine-protein kinase n=1 Tax=Nonomuraea sp. NPDC049714 TaxID=3364357 RepID=UPI003792E17E